MIIIDNTNKVALPIKHEIYHALSYLGYDVCALGHKIYGPYYIPCNSEPTDTFFDLSCENYMELEYKGIVLWDLCKGQLGYDLPDFSPGESFVSAPKELKKIFSKATRFIDFFETVLDRHRPQVVVVWGGLLLEPQIMAILCRRRSTPVYAMEFSFDPKRIHFDISARIGNDFSFNNILRERGLSPLSSVELKSHLEWVQGHNMGKAARQPQPILSGDLKTKIDALGTPPLLLLCQCYVDSVISYDNPHYKNSLDAYYSIIDVCEHNKIALLVKTHPGDRDRYKQELREFCDSKENILFIGLDQDENVYELMDAASAGITINSQSGLEMLARGKKVLTVGRAFYQEYGLCNGLSDANNLENDILSLCGDLCMSEEEKQKIASYVFRLREEHLINPSKSPTDTALQLNDKLQNLGRGIVKFSNRGNKIEPSAKDSLRIVIIHPSPSWGGSGYYLQDLAMQLMQMGHKVVVFAEGSCAPYDRGVIWMPLEFTNQFLNTKSREYLDDFEPNLVIQVGVRSKTMRAALEVCISHRCALVVQAEDDEFVPFYKTYPGANKNLLKLLDKPIISSKDIDEYLSNLNTQHFAKMLTDPLYDRGVEPTLRAVMYHMADGMTAIWEPMSARLSERFGKPVQILPPIVNKDKFDPTPLSEAEKNHIRNELSIPDDSLVYFINGTIYDYSDEFKRFTEALEIAQSVTDKTLVLLTLGEVDTRQLNNIVVRSTGRLDDDSYVKFIKFSDVICAPGINDTFNKYRLPSRLIKGMMLKKPILTFKTGFANSLEDDVNGFFTLTNDTKEWAAVIEKTFDSDVRQEAAENCYKFAQEMFDAKTVATRLEKDWQDMVKTKDAPKPIASGLFSLSEAKNRIEQIYYRHVPINLRQRGGHVINKSKMDPFISEDNKLIFINGFKQQKHGDENLMNAHKYLTAFAISPYRESDQIEIVMRYSKNLENRIEELSIFDIDGNVKYSTSTTSKSVKVIFRSRRHEFLILGVRGLKISPRAWTYWDCLNINFS